MKSFWDEELSDEREAKLADSFAREVKKRGLEIPAVMFLELHRPLSTIGAHFMVAASPFLAPFVGFERVDEWSRMLAKKGAIERLLQKIEEKEPLPTKAE